MNLRTFFSFQGRVDRTTYALAGIFGVLLKHVLDHFLAARFSSPTLGLGELSCAAWNAKWCLSAGRESKRFSSDSGANDAAVSMAWTQHDGQTLARRRFVDSTGFLFFLIPVVNIFFFCSSAQFLAEMPCTDRGTNRDSKLLSAVLPKSQVGVATVFRHRRRRFWDLTGLVNDSLVGYLRIDTLSGHSFFYGISCSLDLLLSTICAVSGVRWGCRYSASASAD